MPVLLNIIQLIQRNYVRRLIQFSTKLRFTSEFFKFVLSHPVYFRKLCSPGFEVTLRYSNTLTCLSNVGLIFLLSRTLFFFHRRKFFLRFLVLATFGKIIFAIQVGISRGIITYMNV